MRPGLLVFWLFSWGGLAAAQEKAAADTTELAAAKALAAFQANDRRALAALAAKDDPDPWLVADELCLSGERDAAAAFASAAPRKDTEKLPGYAAARRDNPSDAAARKALAAARAALTDGDPKAALVAIEGAYTTVDDVVSVMLLFERGSALARMRRFEESAVAYALAADAAERLGWTARVAAALSEGGMSAYSRGDRRGALKAWARCLAVQQSRGDRVGIARALVRVGLVCDQAKALEYQQQALKMYEELGDHAGMAATLVNIGVVHEQRGDYSIALESLERGLREAEAAGKKEWAANALANIGNVHARLGAYLKALEYQGRALKAMEELGDRAGIAMTCVNIGSIHTQVGAYMEALKYQQRALTVAEELGSRRTAASATASIGFIHRRLGDYASALAYMERGLTMLEELGDRQGISVTLANIGNVYAELSDLAKALEYHERALKTDEEIGDRGGVAASLVAIGDIHRRLGNCPQALEYLERSLAQYEEMGIRTHAASILREIGLTHEKLGAHARALEYLERSLALSEEMGDRGEMVAGLSEIGAVHMLTGLHEKALGYWIRAQTLADETGIVSSEVRALWGQAVCQCFLGKYGEAVQALRSGVERLPLLVGGLAEEQGATALDKWVGLVETGVLAAQRLQDPAGAFFFLESGRAGALLESLGSRDALAAAVLPEELRRDADAARAAVMEAQARLDRALAAGQRSEIRSARTDLDAARETTLSTVARIQRAAKAAADVAYPKAAPLKEIQAGLAADEALVSYALVSTDVVALVVTRTGARIVPLGSHDGIRARLEAVTRGAIQRAPEGDAASDPARELDELRKTLVLALGLEPGTKRLLISPTGQLAYAPFAVLAKEWVVSYVPSGTTHGMLLKETSKRGVRVLALGDPAYGRARPSGTISVLNRGGELAPLPATAGEAKAVGDTVLLQERATKAALVEALAGRPRWRSVHLACHGMLDSGRPLLSSLALTADETDDGLLTVLDVVRMRISADLVVLSACETGKGKVHRAEGVVGFVRAFMMAGAPRVIVSLWKVDDDATSALMVKFYELWNPKDGSKGLPTAVALKKAQEFVAGHEKWKHPYYWAAWQLWGLGE